MSIKYYIGVLVFITSPVFGQNDVIYTDGPYISYIQDSLDIFWVTDGQLHRDKKILNNEYIFNNDLFPEIVVKKDDLFDNPFQRHQNVSKFLAISDIHGQHDLFITLLQEHKVIDSEHNWIYGDGHVIVVGDIMDRGDKVTESLWFLYNLETQAQLSGGHVHTLLGNHELMIMHGDLRYLNPKYNFTSGASQTYFPDLFSEDTVLGRWLRSKNMATVVNNIGFVHAGISPELIKKEQSLERINDLFKNEIVPFDKTNADTSDLLSTLYFEDGPMWYRGYANPKGFSASSADSILSALNIEKIVVGHTSMPRIVSILNQKIILIDSSIKFGKYGEVLIYEDSTLYRGMPNGDRLDLSIKPSSKDTRSPFQYVYTLEDADLTLILDTDLGHLMGRNRKKEKYQNATLSAFHNLEFNMAWDVRIKTRGNRRKEVCRLPPLKIDFSKSALDQVGFSQNDKLKMVLPCANGGKYQQALYMEHVIYRMYQVIDSMGYCTHLVNVILEDEGKPKYEVVGFLIEDQKDYESRTQTKIIGKGIIRTSAVERLSYLKMMFFQYMILNTDFSVDNRHNMSFLSVPDQKRPRVLPYDFDYAGIINQDYAVPAPSLYIDHVRQPKFRGRNITQDEVISMRTYFNELRNEIEAIISEPVYLSKKSKKRMLGDVNRFYKVLDDEKKSINIFVKNY